VSVVERPALICTGGSTSPGAAGAGAITGATAAIGATGAAASGAGATGATLFLGSEVFEDWQPAKSIAANINGTATRQIQRVLFFMVFYDSPLCRFVE
jgi:hypothetical protein